MNRIEYNPSHRRRANIMLFVVFILGSLFAASMGFLATMRVDRDALAGEADERDVSAVVDTVIDEVLIGRRNTVLSPAGEPYATNGSANPDNPDVRPIFAEGPAHAWPATHEPSASELRTVYGDRAGAMEYFHSTDYHRATDGLPDIDLDELANNGNLVPRVPASRPLRIRALDATAQTQSIYEYIHENSDDQSLFDGSLTDADGDGIPDARSAQLSTVGGGRDFFPAGATGPDGPDSLVSPNCGMNAHANYGGAPSVTTTFTDLATWSPCDDDNGEFAPGTAFPLLIRREISGQLRDQDTETPDGQDDEVFVSLRLLQGGGRVNLNDSFFTLVDNVLGEYPNGSQSAPAAELLTNLPYGVAAEKWLRRRNVLPTRDLPESIDLVADLAKDRDASVIDQSIYPMFMAPTSAGGSRQWFPIFDQPGVPVTPSNRFDDLVANKWLNPYHWTHAQGAGPFTPEYDIRHLLTTNSTDDLLRRNTPITGLKALNIEPSFAVNSLDGLYSPDPRIAQRHIIDLYPGYDPAFLDALNNQSGLSTQLPPGDASFIEVLRDENTGLITGGRAKVPLPYEVRIDPATDDTIYNIPDSLQMGRMQFWLHSFGNIDNPTPREIQTLRQYFMALLSNVEGLQPADLRSWAAWLTVNFVDFADTNEVPSVIVVEGNNLGAQPKLYAGIENHPYISEVFVGENPPSGADPQLAIELFYPHATGEIALEDYWLRFSTGGTIDPNEVQFVSGAMTQTIGATSRFATMTEAEDGALGIGLARDDIVQLLRRLDIDVDGDGTLEVAFAVVDEFTLEMPNPTDPIDPPRSFQRDTRSAGGWYSLIHDIERYNVYTTDNTTNDHEIMVAAGELLPAPVHATVPNLGLEASYPTTGAMFLLMRYANEVYLDNVTPVPAATPMTARLMGSSLTKVDNGHMPVFDQQQWAQGLTIESVARGEQRLAIPWGQLIYDYFTVVPFSNRFDPTDTQTVLNATTPVAVDIPGNGLDDDGDGVIDDDDFTTFLRANQPTVEAGGVVVRGRINLNAAPWKVLEGLPMFSPGVLPIYRDFRQMFDVPPPGLTTDPVPLSPGEALWDQMIYPGGSDSQDPPQTLALFNDIADTAAVDFIGAFGNRDPRSSFTPVSTTGELVRFEQLGRQRAQGIVSYREQRREFDENLYDQTGNGWIPTNYNPLQEGPANSAASSGTGRLHWFRARVLPSNGDPLTEWATRNQRPLAGFLSVGELANVRSVALERAEADSAPTLPSTNPLQMFYEMDNGQHSVFRDRPNYLYAIAPMVALNDSWVTVKGHSYTLYGTVRGAGEVAQANKNAIRFEVGIDRSNLLLDPQNPNLRPTVTYSVREPYLPTSPN